MMMLLGMLWAVAAPLLLLLPAAALVWLLRRAGWPAQQGMTGEGQGRTRWAVSLALVAAVVLAVWLPERLAFGQLCDSLGAPTVLRTEPADGFFLDDGTANSFGMRYLQEEGFRWIEARSIDHRNAYTRYTRGDDGRITETEIPALTAAHRLAAESEELDSSTGVQRLTLTRRDTGTVLASAASAHFQGGTARWLLGMWGTASCPSPITPAGSQAFQQTYHLARDALRPAAGASQPPSR